MGQEVIRVYVKTEEELVDKIKELAKVECTVVMRPTSIGHEIEIHPMERAIVVNDPAEQLMKVLDEILVPIKIDKPHRIGIPAVILYDELRRYLPVGYNNAQMKRLIVSRGYEILPGIPIYGDYPSKTAVLRGYKLKNMVLKDEWKHI